MITNKQAFWMKFLIAFPEMKLFTIYLFIYQDGIAHTGNFLHVHDK